MQADQTLAPADTQELSLALLKSLPDGQLHRLPKHPRRRDLLLAAICTAMHRRYPYTETELNGHIAEQLQRLNALVDHVTLRRYLVDCGFFKRDRAGSRYYLYYPKLEATLNDKAAGAAQSLIDKVAAEQSKRRRAHAD